MLDDDTMVVVIVVDDYTIGITHDYVTVEFGQYQNMMNCSMSISR